MQVIEASVFGDEGPSRLRVAGMQFAVWAFKHAARKDLAAAAPGILWKLWGDPGNNCLPFVWEWA